MSISVDIFLPITKIFSIVVLLALVTTHKSVIHQMNVIIFPNNELREKKIITQPNKSSSSKTITINR